MKPNLIAELQQKQQKLDSFIQEKKQITDSDSPASLRRLKIALMVEIGELANEIKSFKHWKTDKKIDQVKAREELIDSLHFFLSLSNKYEIDFSPYARYDYNAEYEWEERDWNEVLIEFFNSASIFLLDDDQREYGNEITEDDFYYWLEVFEEVAQRLGLTTEEEIKQAYLVKNKINYERQENNY